MIQFLIQALDHTDADAFSRRMATRAQHLAELKAWKAKGNYLFGTAVLNDAEQMIGSVMVMQFETETEFQAYLAQEPYILGNVWGEVKTSKTRVANVVI